MTFFPRRTAFRATWRQRFVFPLPASPWRRVMQPSSSPPPRRSSRARTPTGTFIARARAPSPLTLRGVPREGGQEGRVRGPNDDGPAPLQGTAGRDGALGSGLGMGRDDRVAGVRRLEGRGGALPGPADGPAQGPR